jgi:protein disulfide-isomerase
MANSFNAHRLLHLAKKYNKSNELEELLFKAYLTDGKNINDFVTLSDLGIKADRKDEIETVLHSDAYGEAVKKDIEMAQNVGVQGVPSSSSTINMLFLELNTLKPCENIRESVGRRRF